MTLRKRIALWAFAVALAAAPSLGMAAQICDACCCPPPCVELTSGCGTSLASAACCDEAPVGYLPATERSPQLSGSPAIAPERPTVSEAPTQASACWRVGDLPGFVSPLRLSVVLRI